MRKIKPRPSPKLRALVQIHGSLYAAAAVWEVEYLSLKRFWRGKGSLSMKTAMQIADKTGLPLGDLFEAKLN